MNKKQNSYSSPIGVYDSGSGGLSVLKELKRILPNESFIYFGDTKRMPYGDKTSSQLMSFCINILDYFQKRNVKAAISACNTSSAVVLPNLKKTYPFDIFGMIEPTSKYIANLNFEKVGIIATAATIKTSAYKISIEQINNIIMRIDTQYNYSINTIPQQLAFINYAMKNFEKIKKLNAPWNEMKQDILNRNGLFDNKINEAEYNFQPEYKRK